MNNDNKVLKFKTNIKCNGCVAQVTPFLNGINGVSQWEVDTTNKDKILLVHSESVTQEEVIKKVTEAGFKIEVYI